MRPIRYILDLPWWIGLVIFLLGNLIVCHYYIVGLPVRLFGAWTFSKLLTPEDYPEVGFAIVGFPLFFLVRLIPYQFAFEVTWASWLNVVSSKILFGVRAALAIGMGFIAFRGVRR